MARMAMPVSLCLLFSLFAACAWAEPAAAPKPVPPAGGYFRDCPDCPEMVVVPPGSFQMGEAGESRETPVHQVTIGRAFAIGKSEVTFDEFEACTRDGGCGGLYPNDYGFGRGDRPVVGVSWFDAQAYVQWLSRKTGVQYRLPSEAELEYATRAGSTTAFWWGDQVGAGNAVCDGCGSRFDNKTTAPVCSVAKNPFGLCDAVGNVAEWVQDRWNFSYAGAPADGSAWEAGDMRRRVLRGGSWFNNKGFMHSAFRNGDSPAVRNRKLGFRIARPLL